MSSASKIMLTILSKNPAAAMHSSIIIYPSHHHLPSASQTHRFFAATTPTNNPQDKSTPNRKTRRRTQSNLIDDVPSLADFMHRSKVLKQYRSFVRLALFLDGQNNNTGECRAALEEVRVAYRLGVKKGTDSLSRSMAFSEGERKLKELQSMVGFVPKKKQQSDSDASDNDDADSWMNIKDDDDKRGRVGVQWPWEKNDDK